MDEKLKDARKQASDYALAFDFITRITLSGKEAEIIENILMFIDMMMLPRELYYFSQQSSSDIRVHTLQGQQKKSAFTQIFTDFEGPYAWADSGEGFRVKICYQDVDFGILVVDKVQFPQHKQHYLNLILSISNVCGLTIENARRNQKIKDAEKNLRKEKEKLEEALAQVKTLSGLLPICSYCKKIRDDSGYWNQIEQYIHVHSGVEFSHAICQDCAQEHFPDLDLHEDS
jgi:hypothetical protein